MNLLEKIVERLTPKSRKLEAQLEYIQRTDKGYGCVDVLVYKYNKLTGVKKYSHTVPVRAIPSSY